MRVSLGYRSLIGVLLAGLSTLPSAFVPTGGGYSIGQQVVTRPSTSQKSVPTRSALPTQKMIAEQERLASTAKSRKRFDIYRRRFYNRRRISILQGLTHSGYLKA